MELLRGRSSARASIASITVPELEPGATVTATSIAG